MGTIIIAIPQFMSLLNILSLNLALPLKLRLRSHNTFHMKLKTTKGEIKFKKMH